MEYLNAFLCGGLLCAVGQIREEGVASIEHHESDGVASAGAELPGEDRPWLVVRIASAGVSELEKRRIDALVAAVKPAHVEHRIEWGDGPAPTGPGSEAAA